MNALSKIDKWLMAIHLTNIVWMARLFFIGVQPEISKYNYLGDVFFLTPMLLGCGFHIVRWMKISKNRMDLKIESSVLLRIQLRKISDEMFGKTPYFFKIAPSDNVLDEFSIKYVKENFGKIVRGQMALQRMLFDVKNYIAVNFIILLVSGFYLYFGGLPSYAAYLAQIPLLPVIVFSMAGGFLTYSLAFLMFGCLTFFSKRA